MASSLIHRIKKIESSTISDDEKISAIFHRLITPGIEPGPEQGWYWGVDGNRVDVWRQDGETDEHLRQRAADLCRTQTGAEVPWLVSL